MKNNSLLILLGLSMYSSTMAQTTTIFEEDFNSTLTGWTIDTYGAPTHEWSIEPDYYGSNFDGSSIMSVFDWTGNIVGSKLTSPTITTAGTALTLEFDYEWMHQSTNAKAQVLVFDGVNWNVVLSFSSGSGTPGSGPASLDISSYSNPNLQIAFNYTNAIGNSWESGWIIDNVKVIQDNTVSMNEQTATEAEIIFTSNQLSVSSSQNITGGIQLLSVLGQVAYEASIEGPSHLINLDYLRSGVYLVVLTDGDNVQTKQVFVD